MARVFYLHWNKEEAIAAVRALRVEGHSVRFHADTGEEAWRLLKDVPPDVLVISLAKLPSHGRRVAAVTSEYKKLRTVPLIFVDGAPEKLDGAREEFPAAKFCTGDELHRLLKTMFPPTFVPKPPDEAVVLPVPAPDPTPAPAPMPEPKAVPAPRASPGPKASPRAKAMRTPAPSVKARRAGARAKARSKR